MMYYTHYQMLFPKFCCIYLDSSAFRLFNIILLLFWHLMSFLSFQEIIQCQNIFKIQFYLERHNLDNLELLRTKQISGSYIAHHEWDSTQYRAAELSANRLASVDLEFEFKETIQIYKCCRRGNKILPETTKYLIKQVAEC